MGTIMLYYYICSLVHLYFFCSAFDIFLQDDGLIIVLKSLKSKLQLRTQSKCHKELLHWQIGFNLCFVRPKYCHVVSV